MRVLLANPPYRIPIDGKIERFFIRAGSRWPFSIVKNKNEKSEYMPFPFYLAYTAAILEKENDIKVFVEDGIALNQTEEEFLLRVKAIKPNLILFETATNTINHDIDLIKKIKKINKKIIICLAGFHITSLAQETFDAGGGNINFLLIKEYEYNFASLVKTLKSKKDYRKLPGIAFVEKGKMVKNEPLGLTDVKTLPFPARHLFPSNRHNDLDLYWDGFCQYKPAIQMHGSRGCPFRCNFCVWNQLMYGNGRYRPQNVKLICDEIEEVLKKYHAKEVYFDDDTFTGNKEHVMDFCGEMIKRGLNKKVFWSAMADFMITDEEMIYKMKEAGCIGLKFGVESGNKDILKHIEKPINFDKLRKNVNLCAKLRIKTHATFTFGLSGETKKTMHQTLDLAKSLNCNSLQFSITTPFPGTRYYEELKRNNSLLSEKWEEFDGNSTSVVKFKDMDSRYITNFYNKATGEWLKAKLLNPSWMISELYILNRIRQGQGNMAVLRKFLKLKEVF